MTLLEIMDARTQLLDANKLIFETAKVENRTMTDDEKGKIQRALGRLEELDLEAATEKFKIEGGTLVRSKGKNYSNPRPEFSLIQAIRDKLENRTHNDTIKDVIEMGRKEFRASGINCGGDIVIPVLERRGDPIDAGATGATHGEEIISTEKKAILPPLADKLILAKAGATMLTGLVGNVSIPSYAGTTVAWKGENTTAVDGGGLFTSVDFAPKRLTAFIDVSKLFLVQDGVGAERLLLDNIAAAVARKLEQTILGKLTFGADVPSGIGFKLDATVVLTGATITYKALVGLEAAVETANALDGNLAYITNGVGRGLLKTIDKGVTNDTGDMICSEANMVNGYPLLVTNSIISTYGTGDDGNMIVFGNWKDLCICQWGGYDITIDPYTLAATNQVRITINSFFDAKGLRGVTGSTDEYALSFAALSIK